MFRIRYKVENGTNGLIEGHVDHLLIRDERSFPLHEGWHRAAPLEGGASYEAEVEFPGLETGRYELWLTLDSQGDYEQGYDELVIGSEAVSGGDAPGGHAARGDRGDGQWAHTYHVTVITKPAPVEPIHAGEPFRIEYEAYNEGGQQSPATKDWCYIEGAGATWESWWHQDPLDPGQHYWPTVEVPALPEGDGAYVLKWRLEVDNPDRAGGSTGETPFRLPPAP